LGLPLVAASLTAAVTLGLVLWQPPESQARPSGSPLPGRWAVGCVPCHAPAWEGTVVTSAVISAPLTVAAGSTVSISAVVSGTSDRLGPPGIGGGMNVAASRGTLQPGPNSRILPNASTGLNELTHITRTNTSWSFSWTAPITNGPIQISAALLLANGELGSDGAPLSTGDNWQLVRRTITVTGGITEYLSYVPKTDLRVGANITP
jgi:hypothetical protein